jgi:NADPH:quinone reductase-like Zn-dependent oxidoreductase
MKAIVCTEYGPPGVLRLAEVETPSPRDGEVRVRVYATTVNYGDLMARNFKAVTLHEFNMPFLFWVFTKLYFGIGRPKVTVLGSEFAGVVDAVGGGVTRFKEGDQVFGYPGQSMGAYAEYLCMPEDGTLALKPAGTTYEEAAAVPYGAMTALNLLRKVDLQPGQRILINGASGSIGSGAVQLAKRHFGAHVTGVCGTPRLDYVRALGADEVVDYTREDFTQNGETYDVIFDILGRSSFARCKGSLNENGRYLLASFKLKQLLQMLWTSIAGGKKVICALSSDSAGDLEFVKELAEAGTIRSIIDRSYPLEQAAEAHRYVESGGAQGKVVITVAPGTD